MRKVTLSILALLIGCLLSFLLGEILLRSLIFSHSKVFALFQNPSLYADYRSDDDWWKLYLRVGGIHKPPEKPHPLLGWVHKFDRDTYRHAEADRVGNRRPVLLFGDSFADCVEDTPCFETYLNADPEFSQKYYLLNYGVGGYGLDQIDLLMSQVIDKYPNPIVVFSFMLEDLDRCIMSFRGGEKPMFELVGNELTLKNVPIDPHPYEWLARNPISIRSYLLEFLKRAPRRVWGRAVRHPWIEESKTEAKQRIGGAILQKIIEQLRQKHVTFTVLVFHPMTRRSWRDDFVRSVFEELRVPYERTERLVQEDFGGGDVFSAAARTRYMLADLDHPSSTQNRLVSDSLKKRVLTQGEGEALSPF
jgi:hypothetical protein